MRWVGLININTKEWQNAPPFMKVINKCFQTPVSVACNFLDERNGNKTDLHNDVYTCIDPCDGTFPDYTCMSCQAFFLKSIQ